MPVLFDNLIASVVAGTVLLMLVSIQMQATNTGIANTARYAALNEAQTIATWLEEDLQAMGRNRGEGETVFDIVPDGERMQSNYSPTGTVLRRLSDSTALTFHYEGTAGNDTTITYALEEAGTRTISDTTRTVFELRRLKNGIQSGGSGAVLGYFDLHFTNQDAEPVPNPSANKGEIRAIRAQFSVLAPFQNEETTLPEIHRMVVVPYTPALD